METSLKECYYTGSYKARCITWIQQKTSHTGLDERGHIEMWRMDCIRS